MVDVQAVNKHTQACYTRCISCICVCVALAGFALFCSEAPQHAYLMYSGLVPARSCMWMGCLNFLGAYSA